LATAHVGDAKSMFKFSENTFDEIYASHVLEHFDYIDLPNILKEWYRVLKPGGELSISVPNITVIVDIMKQFKNNSERQMDLMRMIFGGHINQYDYHQMGFTRTILINLLESINFQTVNVVKTFNNIFNDTSSMKYNGTLISLNVIASK